MTFELYQIIVPCASIIAVIYSARQYATGINTLFESLFWILIWLSVALLAIFPDVITIILSKSLGIKSNVNAAIFMGLAISIVIHFRTFAVIKKQNKALTDMVRRMALSNDAKQNTKA